MLVLEQTGMKQNKEDFMKIIGITGGIGTGKSTILHILEENYNAYIIETDRLAHQLMRKGESAYTQIVAEFGETILDDNLEIDRQKMGAIVFNDKERLTALNHIVHPAVKQYIRDDIEKKKAEGTVSYYIIEAALLIEDGYKEICDTIWGIHVDYERRIERLILGRGGNREKWENVIKNQSSEAFYQENCDAIIINDDDILKTQEQVRKLLNM